jgi:hypothetical protein
MGCGASANVGVNTSEPLRGVLLLTGIARYEHHLSHLNISVGRKKFDGY